MSNYFDFISLFAGLIFLQTLWQLFQNWSKFWDDRVTFKDKELAQRLAIFCLIPIGVLFHEIGHSLATWQVGGTVSTFQWRFYWGYIISEGNFSSLEYLWIALSGNLVSVLFGLLPIPLIPYLRKRIIGELLYSFACVQLIYSLLGYPILSFASGSGDWVTIYDFTIQPYASLTAIFHVGLLWGLWHLYQSQQALRWRLASNDNRLNTWKKLKSQIAEQSNNLESHFNLAYFLVQNNEIHQAKKVANTIHKMAPYDSQVEVLQVSIDCSRRNYQKAIKSSQQLLNSELLVKEQLLIYRIICFSLYQIRRLPEALDYANQGLKIDPLDYKLRSHRAIIYVMLGQHQEAETDINTALDNAPDEDSRQELQKWKRQYLKSKPRPH